MMQVCRCVSKSSGAYLLFLLIPNTACDVSLDVLADFDQYVEEPILLPQSTNSLMYTEPICSIPFNYAFGVFVLSTLSLALAMANNLEGGSRDNPFNRFNLPVQVDTSVRVAQYVGKLVIEIYELFWSNYY